ncbi:carbohydrate kinase family protein [Candidatus Thorarchaeota archaeon]|nr:MAG: carbohydrate kinase family protein [Candidatus Thorarchaeota archaeon]
MEYTGLISILKEDTSLPQVTILPDFFLDHFVIVDDLERLLSRIRRVAKQGGGNILENSQFVRKGGNAINTSSALLKLDVPAIPIITTDEYGHRLLESLTESSMDLSHIHTDGSLSATVSLEGHYKGRKANVMISDSGSAKQFRFDDLTERDLEAIRESKMVVLVNLNHNSAAIELTERLFEFVRSESDAKTYLDIGDPSGRPDMVTELVDRILPSRLVDVLGVNENEVAWLIRGMRGGLNDWHDLVEAPEKWLQSAQMMSKRMNCQIDLHTPFFSSSIRNSKVISVPSFKITERTLCGAGDAWNAGNIYGMLKNLDSVNRLALANAVAALYVSSDKAVHPSMNDVISFFESDPDISVHGTKLLKSGRA